MIKQQAIEKFNNLDIDTLKVDKTGIERMLWKFFKPLIRKYLLALIAEIFKDNHANENDPSNTDNDQ